MRIHYEHPVLEKVNQFLYSPAFFLYLGGLTVLSNVFALELYAYTMMLLTAIYICLFARDILPLMPMFVCGYISPSLNNNPGVNEENIFSFAGYGVYFAVMLTIVAICLFYRLVTDPHFGGKQFFAKKRKLLSGMLLLGGAYALSGFGSGQWAEFGWRNLFFAFLQFVSITVLYYLFSGGVRWDRAPKAYLFWTGLCIGYVLLAELLGIYIKQEVIVDGEILRERIVNGWGHYNNMGAMFTMVIPLSFFLTGKGRYAWFAYVSAFLFCLGLLFTCSRGSILIGVPLYVATYAVSVVHSRYARSLKWMHVIHGAVIGIPVLMLIIFDDKLLQMFNLLSNLGSDASFRMRLDTYMEGIRQFAKFPIFGGSFFPLNENLYNWASAESFTYLFPPRWHNTIVQVLATGGVVCMAAYVVHRVQTIKLVVTDFSGGKLFAGLSIAAMLLTSMGDCHFFNLGPVLLYSAMLAVMEFQPTKLSEK